MKSKIYQVLAMIILTMIIFQFSNFNFASGEVQSVGSEEPETAVKETVSILKKALTGILIIWKEAHQTVTKIWQENILPKINSWWEGKKPEIREQFEEKKQEMKKELKETFWNFWGWLKDLIK